MAPVAAEDALITTPEIPDVPEAQRCVAEMSLRWPDVVQDGRMQCGSMLPATDAIWKALLVPHPVLKAAYRDGIIPILTRVVAVGTSNAVSLMTPLEVDGAFWTARALRDGRERPMLLLGATLRHDGAVAGVIVAEDVFTRPFAPPGERRVESLAAVGFDPERARELPWRERGALLTPPDGVTALDAEPVVDAAPVQFGLTHTDRNQHVNSLVYPRLFEDAALRALARHGVDTSGALVRAMDVRFHKPCFAGQRVQITTRVFAQGDGRYAVIGAFRAEDSERPLHTLAMVFEVVA